MLTMTRWLSLGSAVAALIIASVAPLAAQQRTVSYGAIAYGAKSSAWGDAYGEASAEDANRKALSTCARYSDGCEVITSFSNTCAAVAAVQATGATFVATNEKRGTAESQAMHDCTQKNRSGCPMAASACAQP